MSDGFNHFERHAQRFQFGESIEAMEAKAEVLMADAIEAMEEIAMGLVGEDEPPIPVAERRAACIRLCAETFDRLQQVNREEVEHFQRLRATRGC